MYSENKRKDLARVPSFYTFIVLIDVDASHFDPISFDTCDLARTSHVSLVSQEVSRHVRRSDCRVSSDPLLESSSVPLATWWCSSVVRM